MRQEGNNRPTRHSRTSSVISTVAVGLLRVAARVGPEARQALDAGAGPALRVRAAAVRELLALVARADVQTRPSAAMRKKAAAWIT